MAKRNTPKSPGTPDKPIDQSEKRRGFPSFSSLFALILGCFFVSGLTGLVYEILWTRMIVEIIGSSPFAVSIVLSVFMAGLGLGAYAAGRTIDSVKQPRRLIRIYGILELCIGAYGLALPVLLKMFKPLFAAVYVHLFDYSPLYNFLTFVGCALLLIVPVTLMGATLPVLSRFFVKSLSHVGTHVGRLYGLNTIGAAVGSVLSGFWLIDLLGVQGTLHVAVLLNALIGTACVLVAARVRGRIAAEGPRPAGGDTAEEAAADGPSARAGSSSTPPAASRERLGSYALVVFAVSGFCAMAYEVIWIKLLALIVGPTTYSLTIVLVTFITGLALGAMFFGWLGDRTRDTMRLLLATQVAAGLSALWFSQAAGNSQMFFAKLIFRFKDDFAVLYLVKAAVLFVAMFLPTFCLGATFPLVGKIYTTSLARTGRSIGFAYAANSVGAVLGSFCAGFLLIPFFGKENGLGLVIGLQLVTVLAVGARVYAGTRATLLRWAPHALIAILGLVLTLNYPHWDRKMLAKGKYHRFERLDLDDIGWLDALSPRAARIADDPREKLVYYGDGIGGFTTVMTQDNFGVSAYSLFNSGKADASYPGDMPTQTLFAHFPLLFHPHARSVLIVGLASGITAGEVLNYPVEHLDIVDINDQVVAASGYFRQWNGDVLSDPRTTMIIQDGRAHLALSNRKYDVISSEPSNPWMAGLASLFTRDFYELVRESLNDGGIFVQFAHAYEMDWRTFAMIGRTFSSVFPNGILVNTDPTASGADYLLIGVKGDGKFDAAVAARNIEYARRSKNLTLLDHRLFYPMIVGEDLPSLFGEGPIHTEDRPYLEFIAPKLIFTSDPVIGQMVSHRKRLSEQTKAIAREVAMDVDRQIDYAAYALSVHSPGFAFGNRVNLAAATTIQRARFTSILEAYCTNNVVQEVFDLRDEDIRERCLAAEMEGLEARMSDAEERAPYINRLGEMCSRMGELDGAAAYFRETLRIAPQNVEAHNNLANVLARQKNYDEAVNHHMEAIELDPRNATAYNNLGATLSEQGRTAEALESFSKALQIDPRFADAHYNMGKALVSEGSLDQAIDHFARAVALKPRLAGAHKDLADAYAERGDIDEAIAHYRAAVGIEPGLAAAYAGLGEALARRGDTGAAVEQLTKAVDLQPDGIEALNALAWMLATDPDPRFRDGVRAAMLAERACALAGSTHPLLLDTLAAAYAEKGDFHRAAETARKALALARSAGRVEWARDIEKRLELYDRGVSFRAGS